MNIIIVSYARWMNNIKKKKKKTLQNRLKIAYTEKDNFKISNASNTCIYVKNITSFPS